MAAELTLLSFVCAALSATLVPLKRIRLAIPNFTIVFSLLVYNLIHGINTIIWSGNSRISVPVWCDLVAKFQLAATIAIPSACLCISHHLELVSSARKIRCDTVGSRKRTLRDLAFCLLTPMIYIALQPIVQDHRFDLVQDYGCFASIHPSTPSVFLVWLPPMFFCSIALVYSALALYSCYQRRSGLGFAHHLSSRTYLSAPMFVRYLITSVISTLLIGVFQFVTFLTPNFVPWISFAQTHRGFYDVDILTAKQDVAMAKLVWWTVPVLTLVYVIVSFVFILKKVDVVPSEFPEEESGPGYFLPLQLQKNATPTTFVDRPSKFKSGWDDMLKEKKPKKLYPSIRTRPLYSTPPSPSPSTSSSEWSTAKFSEGDTPSLSFMKPLTSPVVAPPPVHVSPVRVTSSNTLPWKVVASVKPVPPRQYARPASLDPDSLTGLLPLRPSTKSIIDDAVSTISSLVEKPWPLPPANLPTIPASPTVSRSNSPTPSVESGDVLGSASSVRAAVTRIPGDLTLATPFVSSVLPVPNARPRPPVSRQLRKKWSRDEQGFAPGDMIFMTVSKESS